MTEKEKFNKSVGVLVAAYLNDTLQHKNSCGCAVGNLIASAMGLRISKPSNIWKDMDAGLDDDVWISWGNQAHPNWLLTLEDHRRSPEDKVPYSSETVKDGMEQIAATGYRIEDVDKIEAAFELAWFSAETSEERMYNGLMSVVDVLAGIHHVELCDVNEAKAMFVKV